MKNIVSFGAGQNSTAMIIMMKNKGIKIDEILFAETGNEMPMSYTFLKEFEPWCKKNNLKLTKVKSHLGTIREFYFQNKIIPYRMFRSCTDKFKVRPINKYIKETYGKEEINMFMGIASDEIKRATRMKDRRTTFYKFPLIDWGVDRDGCIEIIKKEGLSVPVKSGCYFCPFQPKGEWIKLYKENPALFDDSILFEKNGRAYPEGTLMGNVTLEDFRKALKEQTTLIKEDASIVGCAWCHT